MNGEHELENFRKMLVYTTKYMWATTLIVIIILS